ncbi:tRNA (adenosine(37)-N6)-dimethylallyltransferase MiaA [Nitrosomonas sp. JL21]|uniref:tRNA (adenosine(37)-N6)-dimethylallyltransferase MiaA n=1 Tax=Nitrosomonas sp. JL21 TaxID=153949 RepID=UPI001367A6E2|nr:tRNA (adenosine(37)-N6)-dimethylallyltransferase MiaA [Nitrosomonas sp. JL21]MBL8497919.1 tRNA (adenosine(37)-N6)-dimethylallyltransferase MiaA [Nitrosomonas sp.]MCC7091363.1 tRNA (adenosine(37)-N6)-dimethylallyltransferase MiaA [Nitrosomonas sp.]MXS78260.1 tRNA (adenosine(37)-N6)-dimethylallyltransferase MiaA [Nitrosomonas sp. JL21]
MSFPPAIFIMGPTASGKSRIALDIAAHFPVEIISVDSAQVFRLMNIGTAKPDQTTLSRIPHHLIDVIDPDQHYSAAEFRRSALTLMHEIIGRNKIPILVGGTMLYFRALQEGLSVLPSANPQLRHKLENMAEELGWPAMHQKLIELDPETAARIKPTDSQRIQRALEVCHLTQQPMSQVLKAPRLTDFPFEAISIALTPSDRSQLHRRIAERFDDMMDGGLIEELVSILRQFPSLTPEAPSMRCVGYRQAYLYLNDQINMMQLRDMGIAATRQLAKRQLTWLRSMNNERLQEFDCLSPNLSIQVRSFLQQRLHAQST